MAKQSLVRPSRDGDAFHYLWAARRCLRLLSPNSGLVAVTIEGPSPDEIANAAPIDAGEELIDIAEYYGSEDIAQATLVRYMQLKHSTRSPNAPVTASGIEKTFRGFAARYKALLGTFPANELGKKIEFWFVTNRPVSTEFRECVNDAANSTTPRFPGELQKFEKFTGLTGIALAAFAKLIRFEDRQDGYWDQRNILFQDLSKYLPDSDVDGPTQLKELVNKKALTESESNPSITKVDVLRVLKTDETRLFPAKNLVKPAVNTVAREQDGELIAAINKAGNSPILVHAEGGVGKSVFALRIGPSLPAGSFTVLYDCFGDGQYRSATGYRHRHKDALVQIANELAAQGLCHPLIPTGHADASAYLKAFTYRLKQAATILRNTSPDALLGIVIDAADNAQTAAEEIGEARSFARDLIREAIPDGVRLIFLCRSHRQALLDPPVTTIRLELEAFSLDETGAYLRKTFPEATEQDVNEFHRLSSHNPRVQALSLDRKQSLSQTLRLLGPNPTTVESAIGNLLEAAIENLRDSVGTVEKDSVERICAGLAALRPLIPIPVLSAISGVTESAIKSFAYDLGRPLLVAGETIQFLDEPAETWFRETFKPAPKAMAAFIDSLRPLATSSAYVASALPQLMLEAGQFADLVELALSSSALPQTSPLEKRDVELQRLQFAMKATLRIGRHLDAAKLALKAGGETARDERQTKLLQANTDLVAQFIEVDQIQEIVSRRTFGSGWVGSHHAYEAALLSGREELIGDARSRLRMAHEWLDNWSRLPPDERKDEEISDQDIAELALAHLNIHGARQAARDLRGWTPREVSYRVGKIVVQRLVDHGRFAEIDELAVEAENNVGLVLAIILTLQKVQKRPPTAAIRRTFRLASYRRFKLNDDDRWGGGSGAFNLATVLAASALEAGACTLDQAKGLLARYIPSAPPRDLSSRYTGTRITTILGYTLDASLRDHDLSLVELAHPELRKEIEKKSPHHSSRDVAEFEEDVGALLPWLKLSVATSRGSVPLLSMKEAIAKTRDASSKAARINYRDEAHTSNEIAHLWFDTLIRANATSSEFLEPFLKWIEDLKHPLAPPTLLAMVRLAGHTEETKAISLNFAAKAFALVRDSRENAEQTSDGYLNISRAVLSVSASEAKAYFNHAVQVASKIGDENLSRWDAILDLADRASREDRPAPVAAYKLARCAELSYEYVVRDKHFAWDATVEAISTLCPSSAFAILSRWRDRRFGSPGRHLPVAVRTLIRRGDLDARDALPLLGFRARWDKLELLESALAGFTKQDEKIAAGAVAYQYLKWEETGSNEWERFKALLERHKAPNLELDEHIAYTQRNEAEAKGTAEAGISLEAEKDDPTNWNDVFSNVDVSTTSGLASAFTAFNKIGPPYYSERFFKEASARIAPGAEPDFVRAIGASAEFTLYDLRNFFDSVPVSWKDRPAIAEAFAETIKLFCRRFCMSIKRSRYYQIFPVEKMCELSGISEHEIAEVVLETIGQSADPLDADRLFSLSSLLRSKLTPDEALAGLVFGLDLFEAVLEDTDGDGPWSTTLVPPASVVTSLAGYIWAALGAPQSILRWSAAHAILDTCALGRVDLLGSIFDVANLKKGGPFVDARLPFYELNALQWLLIASARAATEHPRMVAPFVPELTRLALHDQPHVMIRAFAARAVIALIDLGAAEDKNDLRKHLSDVNVTKLRVIDSKLHERVRRSSPKSEDVDDEDRFYFGIDMGPYWYEPLGRVFAFSQKEIEALALKAIRNDLGFAASGKWDEDERSRRKFDQYEQTSHSHGSYPKTHDLRFYLSYHAMMIVAGRLLATEQTHLNSEWGETDEFADWISRHDLARKDGRWLSDRRDATPLEAPSWRKRPKDDELRKIVTPDDFDEALRSGSMLNVWGHWSTAEQGREQNAHVYSALVVSDKSVALLRALQTTKDVYDYGLPDSDGRLEIKADGFELKGWISNTERDSGLDMSDFWSGGVRFPPPMPATFVTELMGLSTDLDCRTWKNAAGAGALKSQVWGHFDLGERHSETNPERGSRLQASLHFITEMLAKLDRDLIVQVQIERHRRYRSYESSESDDKDRIRNQARLYLIKRDGSIATI